MPELPEVEIFRRYFARTSLNKKIVEVDLPGKTMLGKITSNKLIRALVGNKFTSTHRHGKYMFAEINGYWLVLHFGMTGFLKYYKNEKEKPGHVKLLIKFDNNYFLAYDCMRKLGVIDLTADRDNFIKDFELGIDPLSDDFGFEKFNSLIEQGRGNLKTFFMNQKHIAGLGNIYVDELLFQTNLHPKSEVSNIEVKTTRELFNNMKRIINKAIEVDAKRKKIPRTYLVDHRSEGERCPRCKGEIKMIKISGRSTYFCDKHQAKV